MAQEQRQWKQAEEYFLTALETFIEFKDRYSQATTYHNLGFVAEKQGAWNQAEEYYLTALEIYIEIKDRYSQASTYNQLGGVAGEQEQWKQAEEYFLMTLEIYAGVNDGDLLAMTLRNITRLWRASGDADLPGRVAKVLGIPPEKAEDTLRSVLPDEGE